MQVLNLVAKLLSDITIMAANLLTLPGDVLEIEVHPGPPASCGEVTLAHQGARSMVGFFSDFSFLPISLFCSNHSYRS